MTAASHSTRRKLSLLQLAEELGNVSKACELMGYHRDTFYEVKRAFQIGGVATLVERIRSTNTVADAGDGGCYLVWGCWSSEPRDARLKTLASSRC
jgi:hypothetical protein